MKALTLLLLITALVVAAAPTHAFVLGLDWGVIDRNTSYDLYVGSLGGWLNHAVLAGSFNGYAGGTLGNPLPPNDGTYFGKTYCVDLSHWIELPTEYEVTSRPISELAGGQRAAWLMNHQLASVGTDTDKSAGLQLAIWNAVYDSDFSIGSGNFKASNGRWAARQYAGAYLSELQTAGAITGESASYYKADCGGQDMLATPVPEPASLLLLGLGLGASGFAAKRKRHS